MYTLLVSKKQQDRAPKKTELGKLLRAKRRQDGLTLRDAAERIDFDHGGLSEIENGLRTPDWETLVKIHDGLKIPLDDLLRAAAKDKGVDVPERSDQELVAALTDRSAAFPDLLKVLRRLEKANPKGYRWFLRAFDVFEAEGEQDDEDPP